MATPYLETSVYAGEPGIDFAEDVGDVRYGIRYDPAAADTDSAAQWIWRHFGTVAGGVAGIIKTMTRTGRETHFDSIDMNNNRIENLDAPVLGTDAARLIDVQNVAQGTAFKEAVFAATDQNVADLTTLIDGAAFSGTTLATGERIGLFGQTDPIENGIYVVAAAGAPPRSADMDETGEADAKFAVYVEQGTLANRAYTITNTNDPLPGTDPINWALFQTDFIGTFGDGLTRTGDTIDIDAAQPTITSIGQAGQNLDLPGHDSGTNGLSLGGTLVTASATEINYLDGALPGTITANTAVVADANGNLPPITNAGDFTIFKENGAPADFDETCLIFQGSTDTTPQSESATVCAVLTDVTDATKSSRLDWSVYEAGTKSTPMNLTAANGGTLTLPGTGSSVLADNHRSLSDRRHKTQIERLTASQAFQTVMQLSPVTYKWKHEVRAAKKAKKRGKKTHVHTHTGFIAQEVDSVISTREVIHDDGELVTMDYGRLSTYTVGGLQHVAGAVAELAERLERLERCFLPPGMAPAHPDQAEDDGEEDEEEDDVSDDASDDASDDSDEDEDSDYDEDEDEDDDEDDDMEDMLNAATDAALAHDEDELKTPEAAE